MITATTMDTGIGKQANFTIHNGAKMLSVCVDNSAGAMTHMARADIRLLFSNNTAGIEGRPSVEDVTGQVFNVSEAATVHGSVQNMAKAMNWLQMARWGLEGQTL